MTQCSVDGCLHQSSSRGWCQTHYARWRKYGDPLKTLIGPMGGGYINNLGYKMRTENGLHKAEHIRIVERVIGRTLPDGAQVHHVDGTRSNNGNTNLVVCPNGAYHSLLHVRTDAMNACGNPNWRKCVYCKNYDAPENMYCNKSNSETYNHRACFNERQRELRKLRGRSDRPGSMVSP